MSLIPRVFVCFVSSLSRRLFPVSVCCRLRISPLNTCPPANTPPRAPVTLHLISTWLQWLTSGSITAALPESAPQTWRLFVCLFFRLYWTDHTEAWRTGCGEGHFFFVLAIFYQFPREQFMNLDEINLISLRHEYKCVEFLFLYYYIILYCSLKSTCVVWCRSEPFLLTPITSAPVRRWQGSVRCLIYKLAGPRSWCIAMCRWITQHVCGLCKWCNSCRWARLAEQQNTT